MGADDIWDRGRPARNEREARKDFAPAERCGRDARGPNTRGPSLWIDQIIESLGPILIEVLQNIVLL